MQASHTLYVAPELCTELILGEDWLKARKACLEFEPAKLILEEIEVPLGGQGKDNTCADLLSRIPKQLEAESIHLEPGVDDRAYQVNAHTLENRPGLEKDKAEELVTLSDPHWREVIESGQKGKELLDLRKKVEAGKAPKYVIYEDILYYLSGADDEPRMRMFVQKALRTEILEQCHEKMGHMGIDKTHELIGRRYYWPKLYAEVTAYVGSCRVCQTQSRRQKLAPLMETDLPNFPFEKVSMDISGPYGETPRGNQYIVSFVDWLTNWPEAYAIPDKKAQTVSELILTKIFPRYGSPVQLVTDNGPENVNRIMKEALECLSVNHVTTSPYPPQSNAKVERFHKTLADILSKLVRDNEENWDLFLTQALAAVRFCENETSKFSPYYMIFGRDVVLPVDNLLKPRRKYMGEDHHKLIIERQHKTSAQARRRIARAQKRRNERINKEREEVSLGLGDPVYYKVNLRKGKLSPRWEPCYRIVEQRGPATFLILDQVSGKVK